MGAKERPASLKVDMKSPLAGLIKNPRFFERSDAPKIPAHYKLEGDVEWVWCGGDNETTDSGIALDSGIDVNQDGQKAGQVSQLVADIPGGLGKWFRFSFRGLAEPGFSVEKEGLFMRAEFFAEQGKNALDGVTQSLYPLVERDRQELAINGKFGVNGGAIWKTYVMEFRLPFAEIDTLNLSVGFKNGIAKSEQNCEFYVTEFVLTPIPPPEDAPQVVKKSKGAAAPSTLDKSSLTHLGGRWYYQGDTSDSKKTSTLVITAKNADRLYYLDNRLSNPFAENMTAWLRKGHLDLKGEVVEEDRFLPDNVVLEFHGQELVVHARNIPNHPTAKYPGALGNPNSIREGDHTYYLPLEPTKNQKAIAMDKTNSNGGLPMGPIGFAVNGCAFFNPFDMGRQEAVNMMDRCCGHPAPNNQYHYHKYPVCVKSPFVDDGEDHSPLIGFALDGFPLYGPYESQGVMAKDLSANGLNDFNMHYDEDRGWHYHVTPGKYPYLIGGFAGTPDPRNMRRGPPR